MKELHPKKKSYLHTTCVHSNQFQLHSCRQYLSYHHVMLNVNRVRNEVKTTKNSSSFVFHVNNRMIREIL